MLCSSSLLLPSNGSPKEVDILIRQNVSPAEMAPIPSYPRRRKPAACTTLSTSCRIRSLPTVFSRREREISEATKEPPNWFFHHGERVIPVNFQNLEPAAIWPTGLAFQTAFRAEASGVLSLSVWQLLSLNLEPLLGVGGASSWLLSSGHTVCRLQATGKASCPCASAANEEAEGETLPSCRRDQVCQTLFGNEVWRYSRVFKYFFIYLFLEFYFSITVDIQYHSVLVSGVQHSG